MSSPSRDRLEQWVVELRRRLEELERSASGIRSELAELEQQLAVPEPEVPAPELAPPLEAKPEEPPPLPTPPEAPLAEPEPALDEGAPELLPETVSAAAAEAVETVAPAAEDQPVAPTPAAALAEEVIEEPEPEPTAEETPIMEPLSEPAPDQAMLPEPPQSEEATSPQAARGTDLEVRIGAVWLNRIGLVAILVAFALLGRYVTPSLLPWHKVALSYLASGVLSALGWVFRQRLQFFARPVMAGGVALAFFTSFAAHFLGPMACVGLAVSLTLMSASIAGLLLCAERWRSEPTAGLAIFLGHVAAYVAGTEAGTFSVVAILFLCVAALILFWRQSWLPLNLFSVIAAYVSHFLWALRATNPADAATFFWQNLPFLASYYVVFLVADLIYRQRLWRSGADAFTPRQRTAGRAVGPAALILFVSLAAWLFQTTAVYWDRFHLFLAPLAVVQALLVPFHRRRSSPDFRLYATSTVVFASLALFSWLEGLTLNMALAAEALLLLVLARVLRFWFLTPLAQIVLAISFVHFWLSDSRLVDSWPAFLGSVATAAVYMVKARLMETWRPIPGEGGISQNPWAVAGRRFMDAQAGRLALIQGLAGAVLLYHQCHTFFDGSWQALALAVVTVVLAAVAIGLVSLPMMVAALTLQLGCLILLSDLGSGAESAIFWLRRATAAPLWAVNQLALILIASSAAAAAVVARRRRQPLVDGLAVGSLLIAACGTLLFCGIGGPNVNLVPLWVAVPLALWLAGELWQGAGKTEDLEQHLGFGGMLERWCTNSLPRLRPALPVLSAVVTVRVAAAVFPTHEAAGWFLSWLTVALVAVCIWRRSPQLLLGLATHLVVLISLVVAAGDLDGPRWLLLWWIVIGTAGTAAALMVAAPHLRRGSFFATGALAQMLALAALFRLCATGGAAFVRPEPWLAALVLLWAATNLRALRGRLQEQGTDWHDRLGLDAPAVTGAATGPVAAVILAGLQTWMVHLHLDRPASSVLTLVLLGAALLAVSVWRREPLWLVGLLAQLALLCLSLLTLAPRMLDAPMVVWWAAMAGAATALVLLAVARWQRRASCAAAALPSLALAATSCFGLANWRHGFETLWLWLLVPVAGWIVVELLRTYIWWSDGQPDGWSDRFGLAWLDANLDRIGIVAGAALSGVLFVTGLNHFSEALQLLWFTAAVGLALLVAAALRHSPALVAAVVCHLALTFGYLLNHLAAAGELATWTLTTEAMVVAGTLLLLGPRVRRGSYLLGGVAALAMGVAAMIGEMISRSITFSPYWMWLLPVACCWPLVELLRHGLAQPAEDPPSWRDRLGLSAIGKAPNLLGVPLSIAAAVVLTGMTAIHFDDRLTPTAMLTLFTVLFVAGTAIRRSAPCAAAGLVLLSASHVLYWLDIGPLRAAVDHPLLALSLLVVTLAIGAAVEVLAERSGRGGGWAIYPYLLGFLQGHMLLGRLGPELAGVDTAIFPAQMILAAAATAVAWYLRLPRLHGIALTSTGWVFATLVARTVATTGLKGLFMAGLLVCLLAILVERLTAAERSIIFERLRPVLRWLLIVAVAVTMLLVAWTDPALRGTLTTVGWSGVALTLVGLGFLCKDRLYRRTGLVVAGLSILRVVLVDMARAETPYRILAFFFLGGCLVAVSFLYTRFRDQMSRWL